MVGRESGRTFSGINVTPLTDVMLVLLITFLLTASSLRQGRQQVPLPQVATLQEVEATMTVVTVSADGTPGWGADFEEPELEQGFERLRGESSHHELALAIHRDLPYGRLFPVLEAARSAGWDRIVLLTEEAP